MPALVEEPGWRSGRSSSPPARCDEHIPLPPTMQPYLHILSHPPAPTGSLRPKTQAPRGRTPGLRPSRGRAGGATAAASRPGEIRLAGRGLRTAGRAAYDRCALRREKSLLVLAAIAALIAFLAAGCGSSSHPDGTEADPATAVPATAPLYLGATVRPSGDEQSGALAAGRALTGSENPYQRLLGALRTPGSPQLDYEHDVAPWLGPHAGLFALSLGSASSLLAPLTAALTGSGPIAPLPFSPHGLDGALVMDARDTGAARSFLSTQAKRAGAHASSYRGVSYEVSPGGVAFGLVGRFVVIGTEAGLRAVIGATQGESALSSAPGYSKLAGSAPDGAIAHLYASPGEARSASGSSQGLLEAL